jgi:hypothetical protein
MKKIDPDKYFTDLRELEPCFPLIEPCKPIEAFDPCRPIEVYDPCTPLDEDEMTARDWDLLNFLDLNCNELFPYANYTLKMIDDMIQEIEICPDSDIIPKNLNDRYKLPRMDYYKIFFKKNGCRKDIAVAKELLKLYVQSPEYIAKHAQNVTYFNDLDKYTKVASASSSIFGSEVSPIRSTPSLSDLDTSNVSNPATGGGNFHIDNFGIELLNHYIEGKGKTFKGEKGLDWSKYMMAINLAINHAAYLIGSA